jgi:uncharacterized protein YfaS (alpha-2-macroglobulin family)
MIADDLNRTIPDDVLDEIKKKLGVSSDNHQLSSSDIIQRNIDYGVDRILSMQNSDGGFVYWQGNSSSDLHITPYVLRSLIYMKNASVG